MPMVETSVAVAMPSTTAARIRNGSASAGSATTKLVATLARAGALDGRTGRRRGSASRHTTTGSDGASTTPGSRPPVNSAGDRHAGHRADGDEHEARRNGFGHARRSPPAARPDRRGCAPRSLHFRKQHRRDRRHVGRLRAGNAGHQIHRAEQHIVTGRRAHGRSGWPESHHRARHAGHLDQQAEEHEQRHRRAG